MNQKKKIKQQKGHNRDQRLAKQEANRENQLKKKVGVSKKSAN